MNLYQIEPTRLLQCSVPSSLLFPATSSAQLLDPALKSRKLSALIIQREICAGSTLQNDRRDTAGGYPPAARLRPNPGTDEDKTVADFPLAVSEQPGQRMSGIPADPHPVSTPPQTTTVRVSVRVETSRDMQEGPGRGMSLCLTPRGTG
ncbi:hypothetical protein SKAU_G00399250 [Synaphobranchus kaupii]|uniref:Uncharacterized protein n=1 Tax=Synaphobranchus kaupii TaxID=118154 RepID=A0A9Q1E8R0_SYNKA|nr:hypothetical protein SKAU_G00399250 [Synaphobranchus kaupii]